MEGGDIGRPRFNVVVDTVGNDGGADANDTVLIAARSCQQHLEKIRHTIGTSKLGREDNLLAYVGHIHERGQYLQGRKGDGRGIGIGGDVLALHLGNAHAGLQQAC